MIKTHSQKKFAQLFDEAYEIVKKDHPNLTVGFIFFGLKALPLEENEKILSTVC